MCVMVVANVIVIKDNGLSSKIGDIRDSFMRLFAIFFCLILIGTELEIQFLFHHLRFLRFWPLRGFLFFQIFIFKLRFYVDLIS